MLPVRLEMMSALSHSHEATHLECNNALYTVAFQ